MQQSSFRGGRGRSPVQSAACGGRGWSAASSRPLVPPAKSSCRDICPVTSRLGRCPAPFSLCLCPCKVPHIHVMRVLVTNTAPGIRPCPARPFAQSCVKQHTDAAQYKPASSCLWRHLCGEKVEEDTLQLPRRSSRQLLCCLEICFGFTAGVIISLLHPPLCRLFSRKEALGVQDPGFAKSPKAQLWAGPSSFQWDTPSFPYSHIFPVLLAVVGLQCHGLGHLLGAALKTRSFCRSQL